MTAPLDLTLEHWIALFRGPLTGLLASWGAGWRDAEELAQDVFAEAWLSRGRLRGNHLDSRIVGSWLRGIARNLFRGHTRAERSRPLEPLPHDAAAPVSETDERMDVLRAAFAELRPELQTVLRMFYLDEASTKEVAALLGSTEKAVESQLYQARRALRAMTERIQAATPGGSR